MRTFIESFHISYSSWVAKDESLINMNKDFQTKGWTNLRLVVEIALDHALHQSRIITIDNERTRNCKSIVRRHFLKSALEKNCSLKVKIGWPTSLGRHFRDRFAATVITSICQTEGFLWNWKSLPRRRFKLTKVLDNLIGHISAILTQYVSKSWITGDVSLENLFI